MSKILSETILNEYRVNLPQKNSKFNRALKHIPVLGKPIGKLTDKIGGMGFGKPTTGQVERSEKKLIKADAKHEKLNATGSGASASKVARAAKVASASASKYADQLSTLDKHRTKGYDKEVKKIKTADDERRVFGANGPSPEQQAALDRKKEKDTVRKTIGSQLNAANTQTKASNLATIVNKHKKP